MIALPMLAVLMVEMVALLVLVLVMERKRDGGCLGFGGHGVVGGNGWG
jgi:preprotein translocase subunit SecG